MPEREPHTLHILKPEVFESNFNQMYALARFDPARFQLVFDDFPVARLYEVLSATVPGPPRDLAEGDRTTPP